MVKQTFKNKKYLLSNAHMLQESVELRKNINLEVTAEVPVGGKTREEYRNTADHFNHYLCRCFDWPPRNFTNYAQNKSNKRYKLGTKKVEQERNFVENKRIKYETDQPQYFLITYS